MGLKDAKSFGARLYALLLYLYPASFRREYGESMLQLFNDQCRSISGPGGYAVLWVKTLRDLLLSVPAAHSNGPRPASNGARLLWTVLAVLGLVFVVNAVILPSWISRMPSDVPTIVQATEAAMPGPYRTVALVAVAIVSTLLALGALVFALRQPNLSTGAVAFVVGAGLTCMGLAINPWLWTPLDRYPVSIAWAVGIWPLAAIAWAVLALIGRRRGKPASI
jgi:hypothetical protein